MGKALLQCSGHTRTWISIRAEIALSRESIASVIVNRTRVQIAQSDHDKGKPNRKPLDAMGVGTDIIHV